MTQRQRILVCGATGFIGRNIVERLSLEPNTEVIAVEHETPRFDCPDVTWVRADLICQEDVQTVLQGIDIVVQAAADFRRCRYCAAALHPHIRQRRHEFSYFSDGLRPEHQTCRFFSCTVMYPSSDRPLSEDDFTGEIAPQYFGVGWTKVYLEKMAEFFVDLGRTKSAYCAIPIYTGPTTKVRSGTVSYVRRDRKVTQLPTARLSSGAKARRHAIYSISTISFIGVEHSIRHQSKPFGLYNIGYGCCLPKTLLKE